MTDQEIFRSMANLGREVGARILYGRPRHRGGSCTWQTSDFIVVHRDSEMDERIKLLADYLAEKDLEGLEVPPAVLERLESARSAG